jgi:pimeloyl-ACP methyl ester carboxylesterase
MANGIRLYFEEHGQGKPILCIHGTSSSALMWGEAVGELEKLGRVIVYDRRGCTRSERPDPYERTSVSEQAEDAAALLKALSATPAVLIGRSYGGGVAIDLTLRHPGHVRALVLLEADPPRRLSPEVSRWAEELAARVEAAAAEGMDGVGGALLTRVVGEEAWEGFPDELKEMFTDNGPAILAELRGGLLDVDPSALASIEQPTLLVAGSDSPDPFRRGTELMAAAIPNSRRVQIAGGHIVDPAHPSVLSFIREVVG